MVSPVRDHYTEEKKILLVSSVPYLVPGAKPRGLWYGVDGDWKRFVEEEGLGWLEEKIRFVLDLDVSSILVLDSDEKIRSFDEEYRADARFNGDRSIDWPEVARSWAGIEIAPYSWGLRFDPAVQWYYGWDAASGCVWDPDGARVVLREEEER